MKERRTVLSLVGYRRRYPGAEVDRLPLPRPLRIAQESAPVSRALAFVQGGANRRLSATTLQLRWDDLGIVEDQHVAGEKKARKLAEGVV
jgi:hypothetical protein